MTNPTSWTFDLDPRAIHMAFVGPSEGQGPIFATPDTADEVVATFDRSKATPEEVTALLDVSRKLLRTSMVHYEFAAVAAEKSIQALELAVRRHLGGHKKETFADLIKRLPSRTSLSASDIEQVDAGRKLRNSLFAHPENAVVFPIGMAVGFMQTSHRLIALLFPEDGHRSITVN